LKYNPSPRDIIVQALVNQGNERALALRSTRPCNPDVSTQGFKKAV
jgi:hypothetical protein